jgi:7-cyano-7-deazaguanine reductase
MNADDIDSAKIPLGREVAYPDRYAPALLFPIPRAQARVEIGVDDAALPFVGHDRWHAYELSWLDVRGKPVVETATLTVPATSPHLIESKSLKLYLNSLNGAPFESTGATRAAIIADLSAAAGATVAVAFGLPPFVEGVEGAESIDGLDIDIASYGPPDAASLAADDSEIVEETLHSALLKSNCPVTGQPDWAGVRIVYRGPRIDRPGLLRYLVSFRDHAEFHEQCVERIFVDLRAQCRPQALSVEARYTRRGGLDINPWRATAEIPPHAPGRDRRQ